MKDKTQIQNEYWPLSRLLPYARNPRKNDDVVDKMVSSIREFGFKIPIIAKSDGTIVDGHLRLKAAKKLGMENVPVIVADDLTDAQVKAFRILANKSANWAAWDEDLLKLEFEDLKELDFDLELTGFTPEEIAPYIIDTPPDFEGHTDVDDVPQIDDSKAVSQIGDIWILGEHRLACGDCQDKEIMSSLMVGEKADMVFTDPPYGVSVGTKNQDLQKNKRGNRILENLHNDTLHGKELEDFLVKSFASMMENCKDDAAYYICAPCIMDLSFIFMAAMNSVGLPLRHTLIWNKNLQTFSIGRLDYEYKHEFIFYTWVKNHHFYGEGEFKNTVWDCPKLDKCDVHPTMKPIRLVTNALKNSSKVNDIVLDVFGGSGTTLIACQEINRRCRMVELSRHYCDVIIRRWQDFTGQSAYRERDNIAFNDL